MWYIVYSNWLDINRIWRSKVFSIIQFGNRDAGVRMRFASTASLQQNTTKMAVVRKLVEEQKAVDKN